MTVRILPDAVPLVGGKGGKPRSLRCSLIIQDKDSETGDLYVLKIEGCLISRLQETGELRFMTPRTSYGGGSRTLNYLNDNLANAIERKIAASPLAQYVGKSAPEGLTGPWLPEGLSTEALGVIG